ncbi:dihydrofolate reductase [Haloprofundus marisrubri]|uniref:dihydrofolate reductase n=1 Tax=Haloprofundus marisrubri TaxID=1514971 RepID=A0A0W1R4P4_9EURY|nr:dihydrofolate reductase [Haloprofundus marisrubri]KTG08377.1 dihydrofolate reductase [Haloprofundus marisrubri]
MPGASEIQVALIAAVAENGVIGADGDMPWHYPEDLAQFKQTTMGHPVVMGRRTYESIARQLGGPLPGRTNIVLSRSEMDLPEGAVHADSVDAAMNIARELVGEDGGTVFVVGGATVYEQFLPRADRLVLTEIHESFEGDTEFPRFDREAWVEVDREEHDEFDFVEYRRRDS